jgi:hypothetical protein
MTSLRFISNLAFVCLLVVTFGNSRAQAQSVGISSSPITPNAKSILELQSTVKGVLLPRMLASERTTLGSTLVSTDEGMTIYNTSDDVYEFWNGSAWVVMGTAGGYDDDWTVVGADIERQSGNVYIGDLSTTNNDLYVSGKVIDWDNSTYFLDPGAATGSRLNEIEFNDGSTSDPSVWFEDDDNSGIYQPANNQIGIVAAGNERLRVESSGVMVGGNADGTSALLDVVGGTSGAVTNVMTLRSDYTANNTGTSMRMINSVTSSSIVGAEVQALTTDAGNGLSDLIFKVHGSGGASGDLEERLRIKGDGTVQVGSNGYRGKISLYAEQGATDYGVTFSANPATTQDVNYTLPPDDGGSNNVLRTDGSGILTWADPSTLSDEDWTVNGTDQYSVVTGNVGIGDTTPDRKLDVNGDISVNSKIFLNDETNTFMHLTSERIRFYAGSTSSDWIDMQYSANELAINEGGVQRDFRIESGNDANLLFVDGSEDMIGIGHSAPSQMLDINGKTLMRNGGDNASTIGTQLLFGYNGFNEYQHAIKTRHQSNADFENAIDFYLWDQGTDGQNAEPTKRVMTLDGEGALGRVGIGTAVPQEELHVIGDVRVSGLAAGGNVQADSDGNLIISSAAGDGDYIQNQNAADQTADFRISGDGSILKGLTMGDGITIDNDNLNAGTVSTQSLAFGNASGEAIGSKRTAGGNQNGLDFFTANAARISIENAGHVGINNTAPNNPLHVVGLSTADFDVARFDGSSAFGAGLRLYSTGAGGRAWTMISTANSAGEGAGKLLFKDETGGNVLMTIENGGNVGIGTTGPAAKLDVAGTIALNDNALRLRGGGDGNHYLAYVGGSFDGPKLNGNSSVVLSTNTGGLGGNDLVVNNGRIGINIATPTQGLLHVNGFYNNNAGNFAYYAVGGSGCSGGGCSGAADVSIYASNRIQASEFNAYSDARIKNVHSITKGAEDIQTIMGIEITNYTKIDQRSGKGMEKKVIAQQVEEVYPQAVSKGVDVIPNIYKLSNIKEGRINVANELAAGSKVRLIFEDRTTLTEVLTADSDGFTVALEDQGQVFVYGEEVSDFRSVDYEAISMLNISATQELYKMIQNLQQENAEVKAELGRIDVLSSELEEIKASLGIGLQSAK